MPLLSHPVDRPEPAGIVYRITEPGREELDALVAQTSTQPGHLLSVVDAAFALCWMLDHIRGDGYAGSLPRAPDETQAGGRVDAERFDDTHKCLDQVNVACSTKREDLASGRQIPRPQREDERDCISQVSDLLRRTKRPRRFGHIDHSALPERGAGTR